MEQQFEAKILEIKVSAVRKEDAWSEAGREGVVGEVKVGTKNTTVTSVAGKRLAYVPNDTVVRVVRVFETEESKLARYRADRNERMQKWYDEYEERVLTKAAFKKMDEILGHEGGLVSDYQMTLFIQAQAEDKVRAKVYRAMTTFKKRQASGEENFAEDLVGVVDYLVEEAKEEMLSYRGLSRSTSVVSNIMDDADREAISDLARKRWYGWF